MTTCLTSSLYFDQINTQNTDSNELPQLFRALSCEPSILFDDEDMSILLGADLGIQLYQGNYQYNPPMGENQLSDPQVCVINEIEQVVPPTRIFILQIFA